jgi:hypothetical protein
MNFLFYWMLPSITPGATPATIAWTFNQQETKKTGWQSAKQIMTGQRQGKINNQLK